MNTRRIATTLFAPLAHVRLKDVELLIRGAAELGLELSPSQVSAFILYREELLDWNARFNLTAITDPDEVLVKHFLDSLTCLLAIAPRDAEGRLDVTAIHGRAIDVGAGAGFPGIPLRIVWPNLRLTLLESVRKKATFLEHISRTLGLSDVEVIAARAEDLAREPGRREAYDYALARAVAPLPVLIEYCLPFLRLGGRLVAQKKGDLQAEIASAQTAVRTMGGRWQEPVPVESSLLADRRRLIVVEKAAPTPNAYPRRAGLPAKQPIGQSRP